MPETPKEMSMETRLLLAFLLMGAVMFLTPYFFKPPVTTPAKKTAAPTEQTATPPVPAALEDATPAAAEADAGNAPTSPRTEQQAAPPFLVKTDFFIVAFSNQGADVRSWILTKYKGNDEQPLDLVNPAFPSRPFSLYFPGVQPAAKIYGANNAFYQQTGDPDGLGVAYDFSDGHTTVHKAFRFEKHSYLLHLTTEVQVDGKPVPHMVQWRGGFGDLTIPNFIAGEKTLYWDQGTGKLVEQVAKAAKNGPLTNTGNFAFTGLADLYFAAVFLPQDSTPTRQVTFSDDFRNPRSTADANKVVTFTGVAVGDGPLNRFELFVGPKDVDLLKSINPKLEQVVNFGEWLGVLAKPLFLIVNWFNDHVVHNFGWAIVAVTFAINMVLFPLKLSNMKSMRKMQALKPQIDAINAKYKNVGIRDPKKAEQNTEVMALYKKYGVNPMGGCFPMLLQIPFFFAFYRVFSVSVEMRGATWLWVTDLSQPEHLAIKILPIIMIASQFIMQKMTPQANVDPNQQKMMMFMPLIFGFMFYNFASGLVLYYLTSNLVSMGQQWFFNHTEAATAAAKSVEPLKKKNGRK